VKKGYAVDYRNVKKSERDLDETILPLVRRLRAEAGSPGQ